jgi:hypothetical protein
MDRVRDLKVLQNYRIWIKFEDGEEKTINFRPFLTKGFSTELLDYDKFSRVLLNRAEDWLGKMDMIFAPITLNNCSLRKSPFQNK